MHCCPNELIAISIAVPFIGLGLARAICFCQACKEKWKARRRGVVQR